MRNARRRTALVASPCGKFGFETLGPFYAANRVLGLLSVRENNKVETAGDNGRGTNRAGGRGDGSGRADAPGIFSADRRFLAYNALLLLLLYSAFRRCVTLVGRWPCGDAVECSSAVEWIVTAASVAQAAACVVVAAVHRQTRTADLLNSMRNVLARGGGKGLTAKGRRSHLLMGGAYAATATVIAVARSVAVVAARPDRFRAADVLLLCLPAAAVPVAVECAIVCVSSAAENACRDVVDRLRRLAATRDDGGRSTTVRADGIPASRRPAKRTPAVQWQQVEAVWRDYWRCCQLVDRLSGCYGLDLAINLTVNMLFFIVYAYVTLMSVYAQFADTAAKNSGAAVFYWNVALVCQLAGVSFRIVFISYRAEKIKQVINSFTYQVVNREIKVSACGFFSVNLSFFHGLIRLATTYLIVIIQYNSEPLRKTTKPATK